jgi:hypothetical protein
MVEIEFRIWKKMVCLLAHICHCTSKESYSRQLLEEQLAIGWDSLTRETRELCILVGLSDFTEEEIHREYMVEAMFNHNFAKVKKKLTDIKYKKLYKKNRDCRQMHEYMMETGIEGSRMEFLPSVDMLDTKITMKIK